MKKIISVILAVVMILSFCACGEQGWAYGDYMSEELYNEYVSVYNNEWTDLATQILAYADNENVLANEQAVAVITAIRDRQYTLEAIVNDPSFIPTYVEALEGENTPEEMLQNVKDTIATLEPAIAALEEIAAGN